MKNRRFKAIFSFIIALSVLILPFQIQAEPSPEEIKHFKSEIYKIALKIGDISQAIHAQKQTLSEPEVKGASIQITTDLFPEEIKNLKGQIYQAALKIGAVSKNVHSNK